MTPFRKTRKNLLKIVSQKEKSNFFVNLKNNFFENKTEYFKFLFCIFFVIYIFWELFKCILESLIIILSTLLSVSYSLFSLVLKKLYNVFYTSSQKYSFFSGTFAVRLLSALLFLLLSKHSHVFCEIVFA